MKTKLRTSKMALNKKIALLHGDKLFPCTFYEDTYHSDQNEHPWHWHDEIEFGIVKKGKLSIGIYDQEITLAEGDGIILNSRVLHKYRSLSVGECVYQSIVVHPSYIFGNQETIIYKKYMKPVLNNPDLSIYLLSRYNEAHNIMLSKIEECFQNWKDKKMGYEWRLRDSLSEILRTMYRDIASVQPIEEITENVRSIEIERVRMIISYIEHNLSSKITIEDIAETVSVSVRECQRCFRKIMGKTIVQEIVEQRVKKAEKMLKYTSMPISEISELCGFNSTSYFIKNYRQYFGISPAAYRKNVVNDMLNDPEQI